MLRQQKFLHELSRTLHDLERRNREAQRDLFLILRSYMGPRDIPTSGQVQGAGQENRLAPQPKRSEAREGGLTLDEVRLLVALATNTQSEPESLTHILKSVKDFNDLETKLGSLRDKGFIFYSDLSDVVVLLPKVHHYLGITRKGE
jgi:hypothetical protein